MIKTKKCGKCGETKILGNFHKDRAKKDGFNSYCNKCVNKDVKKYTLNHEHPGLGTQKKHNWMKGIEFGKGKKNEKV